MTERIGVILMNLGGPDCPEAVQPFLFNLFNDPAIIRLPGVLRWLVARLISKRRAPVARAIYGRIGGRSPILPQTEAQAEALNRHLKEMGLDASCEIAMRYWNPLAIESAKRFKAEGISTVVLLPLYPQFSTTTTESSVKDWREAAGSIDYSPKILVAGCYPLDPGFIKAYADRILAAAAAENITVDENLRLLFSAHGLPEKIVTAGDPYPQQVEASVQTIARTLTLQTGKDLDVAVCYQSRVGPMKWIGPSTEDEISRAGRDGKGILLVPVSFVSEHSETLVELDIEYREHAVHQKVPFYVRVPALGTTPVFISALAGQVVAAIERRLPEASWRCAEDMSCACRESDRLNGPRL